MSGVIETERQLLDNLEQSARKRLGPNASEAEIEAWVNDGYQGPQSTHIREETPGERRERERRTVEEIALMDQWNVPEL